MKLVTIAALFCALSMPGYSAAATPDRGVAGFWEQVGDNGQVGAWFLFEEKNGVYEGRIVKIIPDPTQRPFTVCAYCEGDQKDAPMLGLVIVKGMRREGLRYTDGTILDPRDGSIYSAQMDLSPDGKTLEVRGFIGVALLGHTQVWRRLPDNAIAAKDVPKESLGPSAKQRPPTAAAPAPAQ